MENVIKMACWDEAEQMNFDLAFSKPEKLQQKQW